MVFSVNTWEKVLGIGQECQKAGEDCRQRCPFVCNMPLFLKASILSQEGGKYVVSVFRALWQVHQWR